MIRRFATFAILLCLVGLCASAQGLSTQASKDDWEEINFEFNSAVLSDGFPSLLRLADLLSAHPGFHVRVEGHTDNLGNENYNDKLGMERANTVRDFLVKYGAKPDQVQVSSRGATSPEAHGFKQHYSKTDVARWMNRRVVLTVTDEQGRTVSAGGIPEAIKAMTPEQSGVSNCCADILKRLDKLDEIAQMLKDLAAQNANLKQQVADLQQTKIQIQLASGLVDYSALNGTQADVEIDTPNGALTIDRAGSYRVDTAADGSVALAGNRSCAFSIATTMEPPCLS